jgi:hypothetical protein
LTGKSVSISLALPTHHHDTEALGFPLRNLSLQFGASRPIHDKGGRMGGTTGG